MTHTITVTRIFQDPAADTDDPEFTIDGEHDWQCQNYRECSKDWHRHPKNDEGQYGDDEWSTSRIGHHMFIDGVWMVPAGCGVTESFAHDNPVFQMTELGVFDVDVLFEDWWTTRLVRNSESPRPQSQGSSAVEPKA